MPTGPGSPGDRQCSVGDGDIVAERRARPLKAVCDPSCVGAAGPPGVAVVQLERYRFQPPGPAAGNVDEEQQTEVVTQQRVDG